MVNGTLEMSDLILFSSEGSSIEVYVHTQSTSATTWNITHNLGLSNLIVTVYDSTNKIIAADVTIIDNANITVDVNPATTGKCVIFGA